MSRMGTKVFLSALAGLIIIMYSFCVYASTVGSAFVKTYPGIALGAITAMGGIILWFLVYTVTQYNKSMVTVNENFGRIYIKLEENREELIRLKTTCQLTHQQRARDVEAESRRDDRYKVTKN